MKFLSRPIDETRTGDPLCEMTEGLGLGKYGWSLDNRVYVNTDKASETINTMIGVWPINKVSYVVYRSDDTLQLAWVSDLGRLVFATYSKGI